MTAFSKAHDVKLINACMPVDIEDIPEETEDRAMAWKRIRPPVSLTIWNLLHFALLHPILISILSAAIIGTFSVLYITWTIKPYLFISPA